MPVQMVCDSTSLVSAALRGSLTSSGSSSGGGLGGGNAMSVASSSVSSYFGASSSGNNSGSLDSEEDYNRIENQLSIALKRNQLKQIRYDEVPSSSNEVDRFKSKYTVLKTTASNSNGINGSNSISGAGTNNASTNTNSVPHLMNGGKSNPSSSTVMAKLSTANASCNGNSQQNGTGSSSSSSGTAKDQLPTPKRVLFSRDNVQIGWKATGRKWNAGAGMVNVGNTCYLNSTLQALFHVSAIANWLVSDSAHREHCNDNINGQECIICAMAKTLLSSQNNQGAFKPYLVYSKLRLVCKHLVPGRQEDAHEFLRYLVEAMEKCYLARIKNSKELDQHSKETTPLNQILGGYLRSEVKCGSCGHVSTTFQHFEDLLLDIRKVSSIDEALRMYFAREHLEEMQYKCEACKRKVAATKQFSLERAPFALCIQLKRFSMMGGKINKVLELKNRLDLTPYSSKSATSNGKLTYKLASMVTHLGNTQHCGHYTAIGGTESGTYYVFDDSLVRPISMQHVTSTNAYILFYELESVQNGIKPSASSTATLASFANTTGSSSTSKLGSGGESRNNSSGASSNASPLRTHGTGSNSGHNPLFPSKLENRSNFIGPVLPQQAAEKTKKLVNGLSDLFADDDDEKEVAVTSTSSRVSPISSTTSSLSSPSPVKQSDLNSPSTSGGKLVRNHSASSVKSKLGTAFNSNGMPNTNSTSHNGSFKSSLPSASSSSSITTLPSMPKLCNSPAAAKNYSEETDEPSALSSSVKGAGFPGHSKSSNIPNGHQNGSISVSLVPYDADDDEEDDGENIDDGGEEKKNRSATSGGKWRNGRCTAEDEDDDEDSDEDLERIRSHVLLGPGVSNGKQQHTEEEYSPKSPPVIKTKAGLWKVSDNRPQPSSSSSSNSANSSSNTSPATSGNSSPANYSHMNGNGGSGGPLASGYQPNSRQYNGCNNYNHNGNGNHSNNRNGNDVVTQLYQFSHRGYGAPVRSWNGQQTNMDRELANERREDRKRQLEDDRDTEMDRGRIKKMKTHFQHGRDQQRNGMQQQNPFQNYQNHQIMNGINSGGMNNNNNNNNNNRNKWNNNNNNNNNNNGFGGKYHYQNRGGNNYYHNGNHPRNHNGFRNGRHGRNGFYNKSHHHHQRDKF